MELVIYLSVASVFAVVISYKAIQIDKKKDDK